MTKDQVNDPDVIAWLESAEGEQWSRHNFHAIWHTPLVSVKDDALGPEILAFLFYTKAQLYMSRGGLCA